jgi:hypothetical protein
LACASFAVPGSFNASSLKPTLDIHRIWESIHFIFFVCPRP